MDARVAVRRSVALGVTTAIGVAALGIAVWVFQGKRVGQTSGQARPLEGLQVFGALPDFSLTERNGREVALAALREKVWIANFIYTHCTDTCPLQSARMARLQADLAAEADVRLVSITVDPEADTPQVLAEYATRFAADPDRWLFLTGEKGPIYTLIQEGFHLSVADPADAAQPPPGRQSRPNPSPGDPAQRTEDRQGGGGALGRFLDHALSRVLAPQPALAHPGHQRRPFLHSSRFVLVDRQARIRGYYPGDDEEALGRLRRDVRALLTENRR